MSRGIDFVLTGTLQWGGWGYVLQTEDRRWPIGTTVWCQHLLHRRVTVWAVQDAFGILTVNRIESVPEGSGKA
jgi:hypothetical protein